MRPQSAGLDVKIGGLPAEAPGSPKASSSSRPESLVWNAMADPFSRLEFLQAAEWRRRCASPRLEVEQEVGERLYAR